VQRQACGLCPVSELVEAQAREARRVGTAKPQGEKSANQRREWDQRR